MQKKDNLDIEKDPAFIDSAEEVDTYEIMQEYFGEMPRLNKAQVVDGGNFEAGSPIANEDSPVLASNLYESAPNNDQED